MFHKRRPPVGATPGAMAIAPQAVPPRIHVISYNENSIEECDVTDLTTLSQYRNLKNVTWVDVQGFGDSAILQKIAETFSLHSLAMADVVNVPSRPKAEDYDDHLFILTLMVEMPEAPEMIIEPMGIFIGQGFVVTFQQWYEDNLNPVRNRIRGGKGNIRRNGSDYLAYAILDSVIDGYYPVLERLGDYLEGLENEVIDNPTREVLRKVYKARRELLAVRRAIWPQREAIGFLMRDETPLVKDSVQVFLRDCYDHSVQLIDVIENFRELTAGFTEIYLSGLSHRLNEVMKVLTIISTIFMPLSFIVGIYGMNFEYMPELKFRWAYPAVWIVILTTGFGMLTFFRRRGWIELSWLRLKKKKRSSKAH